MDEKKYIYIHVHSIVISCAWGWLSNLRLKKNMDKEAKELGKVQKMEMTERKIIIFGGLIYPPKGCLS